MGAMDADIRLINSPFDGFDWTIVESADFLEDSVREELIAPLLWTLGYGPQAPNQILRSKRLEHPFVALGATRHRISLVPDYVLYAGSRAAWILDAKAPKESVLDARHEAQAYSYACHRDIRAQWYAVCNGKEFAAFNVADMSPEPRLRFPLSRLSDHWGALWKALAPEFVHKDGGEYLKDFGIHLLKMGVSRNVVLEFLDVIVPQLARVEESLFSIGAEMRAEDQKYFVTFDFDRSRLNQLLMLLPPRFAEAAEYCFANNGIPSMIKVQGQSFPRVRLTARLAGKILENEKEHYLPLEIIGFQSVV
jgi:hypothetical protein